MQNQEQQLIKLLTANGNSVDIHTTIVDGVYVGTLRHPVVHGVGVNVLKALIMAASRKKRYVIKNDGFNETRECISDYECNYGILETNEKTTIQGMADLLVKRHSIHMYFRDGQMHILIKEGMQIQGHGATLFKALADAIQRLKANAKRNDILYSEILDDIEMYEQHYGEIV